MSIPKSRIAAEQFDLYIEELREFARIYKMKVGSPEDLRALGTALDGPGPFREECASMMRSVVYRERGQAPTEELLALLATAWAGKGVNAAASTLQEPIGRIVIFLSGVMRIERYSPPAMPTYGVQVEVAEPVAEYGRLPPRPLTSFAAASEVAGGEMKTVAAVPDLEATLNALAAKSPDVQLYLQLLRQREDDPKGRSLPTSVPGAVVLDERRAGATNVRDDPWAPNSQLQKDMRRFAAQRASEAAALRSVKAARPLHIKALFAVEATVFRFLGPNNFVQRYLSHRLALQGPDRWKL